MTSTGSYEDLFRKEIAKYDNICETIAQNLEAQEQLLLQIQVYFFSAPIYFMIFFPLHVSYPRLGQSWGCPLGGPFSLINVLFYSSKFINNDNWLELLINSLLVQNVFQATRCGHLLKNVCFQLIVVKIIEATFSINL